MHKLIAIVTLLAMVWFSTTQADQIDIIELKNRPAEELIPVLQPMLDDSGAMTGTGFQLMIRTSPRNLQQIRQLVSKLDTASRQMMISVFQGDERELLDASSQFFIRYDSDDIHIGTGRPVGRRGTSVRVESGDLDVGASTISTRRNISDNPIHQLRILDGDSGYIETGLSIPYFSGPGWQYPRHDIVELGVEFKDIQTGFYVLPRLQGEQVTFDISPYKEALSESYFEVVETQYASTTVRGPLGEWIEIGGIETEGRSSGTTNGSSYKTRERRDNRIWIRADLDE